MWARRILVGALLLWALVGSPSTASALRIDDGSQLRIRTPQDGAVITGNSLTLEYEFLKGELAEHVHIYVDGQYQKDPPRELMGLAPGPHEIKIVAASARHQMLKARAIVRFEIH